MLLYLAFRFCIFCIDKMQEISRGGSLLPPSRLFQWGGWEVDFLFTHLVCVGGCACGCVCMCRGGGGWRGVGGVEGRGYPETHSLLPYFRDFPFLAFMSFLAAFILFLTVDSRYLDISIS